MNKDYLSNLYSKLAGAKNSNVRASLLYAVIQIKKENPDLQNIGKSLYLDVKQFVEEYIGCAKRGDADFGYDQIDVQKISDAIDSLALGSERSNLMKIAIDELSGFSFLREQEELHASYMKRRIRESLADHSVTGCLKGFALLSVSNIWTVLLVLALVFGVEYALTLPLADEQHAFFIIEHDNYSDNMYFNHLVTYFASVLGMTEANFCTAKTATGFLILLFFKLFYMLYGGWNAVDIIRRKLSMHHD